MATVEERAATGLRPGGFGMLIVRHVVDELVYNERGNEVLMIKHLQSDWIGGWELLILDCGFGIRIED